MSELEKVAKHWSQFEPVVNDKNYYMSPITRSYMIELSYGKEQISKYKDDSGFAVGAFIETYLKDQKIKRVLSLCCGFGHVEREFLSRMPDIEYCLGLDVAEGALASAKLRAEQEGLTQLNYQFADLNNYSWPTEEFDLIIANGALHHIKNLEVVLLGIHQALTANGKLFACEYVGPSYMDHSTRQLEIINAAAYLVPSELRARKGICFFGYDRLFWTISRMYSAAAREERPEWGKWKKCVARLLKKVFHKTSDKLQFGVVHISRKKELLRIDPSECVRSAEIIPLIKKQFACVEVRPIGGGILQHALDENFYANFDSCNSLHVELLHSLCTLEQQLVKAGEVSIENAFIIAKKHLDL